MGIRFLCHHCKKRLNVKAAQAGKEGQCPHCLRKITVPVNSTIPSGLEKKMNVRRSRQRANAADDSSIGLHAIDEQVTMEGIPAEQRHQELAPQKKREKFGPPDFNLDSDEQSAEAFMLDKPQLPASIGKVDPIAEAPSRVWYFRSRELGEKGPLKGKAMQEYLERGQVKIGCIVWREDWIDWLPAERVFPSLVADAKNQRQKARFNRAFKEAKHQLPFESDPQFELNKRQRRKNQVFTGAIVIGIVLIIVLLVVLLKLVSNNP